MMLELGDFRFRVCLEPDKKGHHVNANVQVFGSTGEGLDVKCLMFRVWSLRAFQVAGYTSLLSGKTILLAC